MKNAEIISLISAINSIRKSGKILPKKVSFTIAKNYQKLLQIYSVYDEERIKLIHKYDIEDENGNETIREGIVDRDTRRIEFNKELNELLAIDNPELDESLVKIRLDELPDNSLTLDEIMALEKIIIEE